MAAPMSLPKIVAKGELEERVIAIDRVSRTVKGGKRMRFRALVVVGDRNGRIGTGIGKANEVPLAVGKATVSAKKQLMTVPIRHETIAHAVTAKYGGTVVCLWPATPGTSIIAGGPVRAVIELAGIKNILGKLHGSTNKTNAVRATLEAFRQLAESKRRRTPAVSEPSVAMVESEGADQSPLKDAPPTQPRKSPEELA